MSGMSSHIDCKVHVEVLTFCEVMADRRKPKCQSRGYATKSSFNSMQAKLNYLQIYQILHLYP
jgi:hypothetical protein